MARPEFLPAEVRLRRINEFAISLLQQQNLDDLLWSMARTIGDLMTLEDIVLYLVQGGALVQVAAHGIKNPHSRVIRAPISISVGEGITGTVAATGRPEIVRDTRTDPRYIFDQFRGLSELTVPIVYQGEVLAVIDTEASRPDAFGAEELHLMTSFANIAASRIASAREEHERHRAEQALHSAKRQLEQRVDERTAELTAMVHELEREVGDRQRAERRLAGEKERLALTLRSIGEGVIATDARGHVLAVSDVAAHLIGRPRSELVGRPVDEVYRTLDDRGEPRSLLLHTPSRPADARTRPAHLLGRAGRQVEVAETASRLRDPGGSDLGIVVVFRDVSAERRLQEEVLEGQKLESLGLLAGGIAHDFNNVLMGILGNLTLARLELGADHPALGTLHLAERGCQRAQGLTRQLLTFARGGAPVPERTGVHELVQEAVAETLDATGIRVEVGLPDDLPDIEVDRPQLAQVLRHLLHNARQAMPEGGTVTIHGGTVREAPGDRPGVRLAVTDHGVGIPEEDLARVFDPYFTTRSGGSGLGLTTSYRIVTRHGGSLRVRSRPGRDTTFEIVLPPAPVASGSGAAPAPVAPPRGIRVLLMDDEAMIRAAVSGMLQRLGAEVVTVTDGLQALQQVAVAQREERPFDLALLDLTIPGGMGGEDACRRLHALDARMRRVVISGYSDTPVLARHRTYGFEGMLQKPFGMAELTAELGRLLAGRRPRARSARDASS